MQQQGYRKLEDPHSQRKQTVKGETVCFSQRAQRQVAVASSISLWDWLPDGLVHLSPYLCQRILGFFCYTA